MPRAFAIALDAFYRFLEDDGWAIASYIALSTLMALFPFLILVTALAAFLGSKNLADEVASLLLDTWPREVAAPIAGEVHRVLTTTRGGVLTASAVSSVYFASSGVESLRIGLNRAYGAVERRNWFLLRLESIAYVLVGALALLALAFLVVLAPLMFATALKYAPWLAPLEATFTFVRFAVASSVITLALVLVHKWLPAGHRRFREIVPGILATLILWLAGGILFGRYLAEFSSNYVTYYAGLASVMIALVYLYLTAAIFMYGGELNCAMRQPRHPDRDSCKEMRQSG
ncbi:MAG TPA: YihY/virulence factor BrkB family protein [Xanthobacteraceae bacterium]|jgi:membrane protein|nr:YihY/virulence factor BrkB family protein [Xanthobacteraceae bacterium]